MGLSGEDRRAIEELFETIEHPVTVQLDLGPSESSVTLLAGGGRELDPAETTRALLEEVCALSPLVELRVAEHGERGPFPRTRVGDRLAYLGTPWGYELTSLVHGIAAAGRETSSLEPPSLEALARIDRDVALEVFVAPT